MKKKFKMNINGQDYRVEIAKYEKYYDAFQSRSGWTDFGAKSIVALDAEDYTKYEDTGLGPESANRITERILRHEIMHAFMYESGLDTETNFARDEILIDFLAIQLPKIVALMDKHDLLGERRNAKRVEPKEAADDSRLDPPNPE